MTKCKEMLSTAGQIFHAWCHCVVANFLVPGSLRQIMACNCNDCRPLAGSFWAAAAAVRNIYRFASDARLTCVVVWPRYSKNSVTVAAPTCSINWMAKI